MQLVYLNGQYIEHDKATISVMDRGFLFGDSIYELVPSHHGKLIGGMEHFIRLLNSLKETKIPAPFKNYHEFEKLCQTLLEKNDLAGSRCAIYFQISRGSMSARDHSIPEDPTPTVVAFCMNPGQKPTSKLEQGFKAITSEDTRRSTNHIKSNALQDNIMLYDKAREQGAIEAILLRNGQVLECTSSNVFIVKDNVIKTPALSNLILPGVTRAKVLQLALANNLNAIETNISEDELNSADEIWVTASNKEICPIVQLNNLPVGNGKVGSMWHQIHNLYQQHKEATA